MYTLVGFFVRIINNFIIFSVKGSMFYEPIHDSVIKLC